MWKIDIFYSVGLFEEEPYLVARRKLEKGERRNLKKIVIAFTLVTPRGFKHCPQYFGRKTEKYSHSLWKIQASPLFRLIR